jgi:tRNA (uracil-5-)-methyltransferase TRM9
MWRYNTSMNADTITRLLEINLQFYQTFALQFSATRQRIQPGVERLMETYLYASPENALILDLGCGNGELARRLAAHQPGHQYVGLDFSAGLLEEARRTTGAAGQAQFYQADLAAPDWRSGALAEQLLQMGPFDVIFAFAALHHLPGQKLRQETLQAARRLLAPDGYFFHSEWQFLNSPRLRERIQPWQRVGLTGADVEPGDYLLDWRSGGTGLRYAHHFSQAELAELAIQTGFHIAETFYSDGQGGNLGLYQVWRPNH